MSDSTENETLCERCRLLSFNDLAIGGREVVGEDGAARLSFLESRIELRPKNWLERRDLYRLPPDYTLVRLGWELDDTLPGMPFLSRSSQLGCVFCQALHNSLEETLAEEAKFHTGYNGILHLVAHLSLANEGVEGLMVEATSDELVRPIQIIFPYYSSTFSVVPANY
jgi:hypothetical protein